MELPANPAPRSVLHSTLPRVLFQAVHGDILSDRMAQFTEPPHPALTASKRALLPPNRQ